jgi:large subunit ribosomal protein L17
MSMLRGLVTAAIEHERLETTVTRAKDTAALVEKMITLGKEGTIAARRRAMSFITKEDAVKKLFEDIAKRFENRSGGYTRVTRTGPRRGDAAEMAVLEILAE